jgi:hypothetical protein
MARARSGMPSPLSIPTSQDWDWVCSVPSGTECCGLRKVADLGLPTWMQGPYLPPAPGHCLQFLLKQS